MYVAPPIRLLSHKFSYTPSLSTSELVFYTIAHHTTYGSVMQWSVHIMLQKGKYKLNLLK
jgi:hypothetical protein